MSLLLLSRTNAHRQRCIAAATFATPIYRSISSEDADAQCTVVCATKTRNAAYETTAYI